MQRWILIIESIIVVDYTNMMNSTDNHIYDGALGLGMPIEQDRRRLRT